MDELFWRPDFAAAPDVFPPDHFNAGVMVVRPSLDLFCALLQALATPLGASSYDGGDTGFLNAYFADWYVRPSAARLSFGYNALRTLHWFTAAKQPGYWQSIHPLKIIHYCSSPKPWETRLKGGELEALWWRMEDVTRAMLHASHPSNLVPSAAASTSTTSTPSTTSSATSATSATSSTSSTASASAASSADSTNLPAFPALPSATLLLPAPPLHQALAASSPAHTALSWAEVARGVTWDSANSKRAAAHVRTGYWVQPQVEAQALQALRHLYELQITRSPAPAPAPLPSPATDRSTSAADAGAGYVIPPALHQIWLGGSFPDRYKAWQSTWTVRALRRSCVCHVM